MHDDTFKKEKENIVLFGTTEIFRYTVYFLICFTPLLPALPPTGHGRQLHLGRLSAKIILISIRGQSLSLFPSFLLFFPSQMPKISSNERMANYIHAKLRNTVGIRIQDIQIPETSKNRQF
jgi:hypothetical protein